MSQKSETSESNISMSTLIHVGVELVVTAGLVYWAHSKVSTMASQMAELNDKVNKYEDILKNQGDVIAKHEMAIRQLYGAMQNNNPINKNNVNKNNINKNNVNNSRPQPKNNATAPSKPVDQNKNKKNKNVQEEDDEDIDEILTSEIDDINRERKNNNKNNYEDENVDDNCDEDGCSVIDDDEDSKKK